ncbi:MAG: T9SS type A sorting domain-containing protein [Bacteroidota bacterium]
MIAQFALSQSIVWEKSYGFRRRDEIHSIEAIQGGYISGGFSTQNSIRRPNSGITYYGAYLVKLNNNGDTIWAKYLNCQGQVKAIKKTPDGNLFAAIAILDTFRINPIRIFKLTVNGDTLWTKNLPNTSGYDPYDIIVLPDGSSIMVGTAPGGLMSGFALRMDINGVVLWKRVFTPSIQTYLTHVERLADNTGFLVSGSAGSGAWATWLNEDGSTRGELVFWREPTGSALYSASVSQMPDGNFAVTGSNSADNAQWYVGKHKPDASKIWGYYTSGGCLPPYINTYGDILLEYGNISTGIEFRKYSSAGALVRSVTLSGTRNLKDVFAVAWGDNDSAVFAGRVRTDDTYQYEDFWFCKMADVGYPYMVATKPLVAEQEVLSIFPNPAKDAFTLNSKVPGNLSIYTSSGQIVQTQAYLPGDVTDATSLLPGLYLYRFSSSKGVSTGKIVKE